jgi:hypothetical protein
MPQTSREEVAPVPKKKTKRTRFVPRAILGSAALVSVVPAVALIDCGGSSSSSNGPDAAQFTVAAQGVAAPAFDAGHDGQGNPPDAGPFTVGAQGVAAPAFDSGFDSPDDADHGGEGGHDSGLG